MVKAGSEGPRSVLKSHTISQRATVLGRKQWVLGDLQAVCLVRATGHRRHMPSSSSSSRSVPSLSHHAGCCRAVPSCYVLWHHHTPSLSLSHPHASLSSSALLPLLPSCHAPCCCAPSLHCHAAVAPLDLPPCSRCCRPF